MSEGERKKERKTVVRASERERPFFHKRDSNPLPSSSSSSSPTLFCVYFASERPREEKRQRKEAFEFVHAPLKMAFFRWKKKKKVCVVLRECVVGKLGVRHGCPPEGVSDCAGVTTLTDLNLHT